MLFTEPILPNSVDNCLTILTWIKEGKAYVGKGTCWKKCDDIPDFGYAKDHGVMFKAEVKTKFKLGDYVVAYDGTHIRTVVEVVSITTTPDGHSHEVGLPGQSVVADEKNVKMVEDFNIGDLVTTVGFPGIRSDTVCRIVSINGRNCEIVVPDVINAIRIHERNLVLYPGADFKVGDRVTANSIPIVGTVVEKYDNGNYSVQFDGRDCRHTIGSQSLALVKQTPKFKVGDRVTLYAPMHSHNGETGEIVRVWDSIRCSVRFDGHSCTHTVDINSLAKVGQTEPDPLKWAEGLIQQLPQTHDGRNSWLMNYGSKEEVITDPAAVVRLLRNKAVIVMTDAGGNTVERKNIEIDMVTKWMQSGVTFTWIRRS